MKIKNNSPVKEIYELKVQSTNEKDIKQILKEALIEKSHHIAQIN